MIDIIYRYDPNRPAERQEPTTADEACRRLAEGNAAFAGLATLTPDDKRVIYFSLEDIGVPVVGDVLPQEPYAIVLGCSDARVPTELIFDRTCNEMFVVRVAGNVLGQEQLGSIDYAVQNLGSHLKAIVVLGHSRCGAVTAAVNAFLKPDDYLELRASHHIRSIVNGIFPAVSGAATALSRAWGGDVASHPGYRDALVECAGFFNAAIMASVLREEFGHALKGVRIVFGVYDMATRRVHVPSEAAGNEETCLRDAPECPAEFREFSARVAGGAWIAKMLGKKPKRTRRGAK